MTTAEQNNTIGIENPSQGDAAALEAMEASIERLGSDKDIIDLALNAKAQQVANVIYDGMREDIVTQLKNAYTEGMNNAFFLFTESVKEAKKDAKKKK